MNVILNESLLGFACGFSKHFGGKSQVAADENRNEGREANIINIFRKPSMTSNILTVCSMVFFFFFEFESFFFSSS